MTESNTSAFMKKRAQEDLTNVTAYVASFTKVVMSGGHTPNILATLAKLREQIAELEHIED